MKNMSFNSSQTHCLQPCQQVPVSLHQAFPLLAYWLKNPTHRRVRDNKSGPPCPLLHVSIATRSSLKEKTDRRKQILMVEPLNLQAGNFPTSLNLLDIRIKMWCFKQLRSPTHFAINGMKIWKCIRKILLKCTLYLFCGGVRSAKEHLFLAWQRLLFVMHIKCEDCS